MSDGGRRGTRGAALGVMAVIVAATLAVFGQVVGFDFVDWDDGTNVFENPHYLPRVTLAKLAYFWGHSYFDLYMPVTYTLWGLCAALGYRGAPVPQPFYAGGARPFSPAPFHALNLAGHVACSLLVFGLLWRLSRRFAPADAAGNDGRWRALACGVGALLFALHPVQVESVAWVTGANNVVSGLFALLALHAYLSYAEQPEARWGAWPPPYRGGDGGLPDEPAPVEDAHRRAGATPPAARTAGLLSGLSFTLATAAYALALLSKPTATALPVMVLVLEAAVLRRPWRRWAPGLLLWAALAGAMALITRAGSGSSQTVMLPLWGRPFIVGDALAFYAGKLLWPADIGIDYGRHPQRVVLASWWGYVTWVVPVLVGAALWRLRARWAGAGALLAVAALLPVLGIVPFYLHHMSTVGDRYLYLALPGPALALAWAVWRAGRDRAALRAPLLAGVALLFSVLGVHSWRVASVWRDSIPMLSHTIAINPGSAHAHNNLGVTLGKRGDPQAFLEHTRRAAELRPDLAIFVNNLGTAYGQNGDLRSALRCFEEAIRLNPRHAGAHYHLGVTRDDLGEPPARVIGPLREAARLDPQMGEAWFRLGVALGKTGDTDGAVAALRRLTALRADRADAHYITGVLLGNAGRDAEAEASLAEAVRYEPSYAEARFALGRVRDKQGRPADALPEYREAVRLAPDNARFAAALREAEKRAGY